MQDAVWQLLLDPSGPITLQTSFGLQAQSFQLQPLVIINKVTSGSIREFCSAPRVEALLPNYISLVCCPDAACLARIELWAKDSCCLLGRTTLQNTGESAAEMGVQIAARLVPMGSGQGMNITRHDFVPYLKGQTGELQVSVVMDGLPKPVMSPQISLEGSNLLQPGQDSSVFWRCVTAGSAKENEERGFAIFPANWDAEIARLDIANQAETLSLTTPFPDWDITFQTMQLQARQLLVRTENDNLAPFRARNTHVSHSTPHGHGGPISQPNVLELGQLLGVFLPTDPQLCADIFSGYLERTMAALEDENDRQKRLPFPGLCDLAWKIHLGLQDKDFLQKVLPMLSAVTLAWFTPANDRDQDGWPEWATLDQSGLKALGTFDLLDAGARPTRISSTESLNLACLLARELEALEKAARAFEDETLFGELSDRSARLRAAIAARMEGSPTSATWDHESHQAHPAQVLFVGRMDELPEADLELAVPARLNLQVRPTLQLRKPNFLRLNGLDSTGKQISEDIYPADIVWLPGYFLTTSKTIFTRVDSVEGANLDGAELALYAADLTQVDIGRLLAVEEAQEFESIVNLDEARFQFGLPERLDGEEAIQSEVNLGWNSQVIDHLVEVGQKDLAFALFERLMQASIRILKQEHTLYEGFRSDDARPLGPRNAIGGLLPLALFLEIAGVRIIDCQKVTVGGANPLPWPLKVQFRGLEITRDGKNTTVTKPDGTQHHHFGSSPKTYTA